MATDAELFVASASSYFGVTLRLFAGSSRASGALYTTLIIVGYAAVVDFTVAHLRGRAAHASRALEHGDALDVVALREQIHGRHGTQLVAA